MAKKLYFENQLKSVTNNPKETWNVLRKLLPKKKCDTTPSTLKFNGAVISDKNSNANSPMQEINTGVPQGSVLGPILFLLYINDLCNALLCKPRLFADDTLSLYSSDNPNKLEALCNNELLLVKLWMDANKLKINTSKSQAIIINYKLRSPRCDIQLQYNSNYIQFSAKIRYLGVVTDHKLSFLPHIQNLEAKVSRNIGILVKSSIT